MSDVVVICLVLNTAPDLLSSSDAPPVLYSVPALVVLASSVVPTHAVGVEVCGQVGAVTWTPAVTGAIDQPIASAAATTWGVEIRIESASWTERGGVPGVDRTEAVIAAGVIFGLVPLGIDRTRPAEAGHALGVDLPFDDGDRAVRAVAG